MRPERMETGVGNRIVVSAAANFNVPVPTDHPIGTIARRG